MKNNQDYINKAIALITSRSETASIAIVDAGGNLLGFSRMPGANLVTIDTAIGKAYTAVAIGTDSSALTNAIQPGGPLFGMQAMTLQPRPLVPFAGGVVVLDSNGQVIGGIGVSGMQDSKDDEAIAREAIKRG